MNIVPNDLPFTQSNCDKYDRPGKVPAINLLKWLGCTDIKENLEHLNGFKNIFDLEAWKDGKKIIVEVEVKEDWGTVWTENHPNQKKCGWAEKAHPFPHPTMHYPYRKRGSVNREMVTHHMTIGGDHKRAFIVNRKTVLNSRVKYVKPRNRGGQKEPFFDAFVGQGHFFEWHNADWQHIKPKPVKPIDTSYLN